MSLSNDIISLLQDEARLAHCREHLVDRPKNAAGCADRLARIDALGDWLKPTLRTKLSEYLLEESYEYRYGAEILSAISAWERWIDPYGDCLLVFARELKNAARILGGATKKLHAAFDSRAEDMARLRLSTRDVDRASLQLVATAQNLSQAVAGTIYEKVRVLAPPFAALAQWVQRLESISNVDALVEMQIKEGEARLLLASKLLSLRSQATTARETVAETQRDYFENYWDELRDHALSHHVMDRAVDEMLDAFTRRHATAPQGRNPTVPHESSLVCA